MDEHRVRPESDMKIHKVNNMMLEDIAVPVKHNQEHNEIVIKEEPISDGEMDTHPLHHEDESPTPFSFVAVKNEIVDEYESWDSVNIKEEVKDVVSTSDCDQYLEKEEQSHSEPGESSSVGSLITEAVSHKHCNGVCNASNCSDTDKNTYNEPDVTAASRITITNVKSKKVRRKKHTKNTGEKLYKCDECNRLFGRKDHLKRHYLVHTGEKPYKCDICNKLFSQNGTLKAHYRVHTGEKPYSCNVCNRRFGESVNLKNHYRVHTEEGRYKCDICSKAFTMRVSLKTHYRSHTGGKTHNCEICRKEFSKGDNLRKHYRTHTGEKPHKCDHCGKEFSVRANLKRHIRIHTGEKPYKCDICSKEYSKSEHLKAHQRSHAGV
jgi:KRAB domain-containing zinc finger protein